MQKRAKIRITGRVQGVFYRQSTREKARSLGVSGWVRNSPDGSVMAEVLGGDDKIAELISWCHIGPPSARVNAVEVEWVNEDDEPDSLPDPFEIR